MKSFSYVFAVVAAASSLLLGGCFPDDVSGPYDGSVQVSFRDTSASVLDGGIAASGRVQLIHPDGFFDRPTTIRYSIEGEERTTTLDPSGFAISFGDAGEVSASEFIFPADTTRVPFTISFSDTEIPAGESRRLVVELIGNEEEGVFAAENYDTFTVSVFGREALLEVSGDLTGFDSVPAGETARDTVFFTNLSDATRETEVTGLSIAGDDRGTFEIVSSTNPFLLQPGQTEAVIVQFEPEAQEEDTYEAQLAYRVSNVSSSEERTFNLVGTVAGGSSSP